MERIVRGAVAAMMFLAFSVTGYAMTVELISENGGVYEAGRFTPGGSGFHGVFSIRENENRIVLEEVIFSDREGREETGVSYEMVNYMRGDGFSALMVSPERKGQKIYTATREGHLGSVEILVIGEDFYEYSKMSAGKFYLESGKALMK